ncbi:MAG: hypothetical protein NXI22_12740 [bacterium]|nr:hypothetical protein [bacterium]
MGIGILLATAVALQVISMSELKYALGKEPNAKPPPQLAEATIDSWQKAGGLFRDSKSMQHFFPSHDSNLSGCFVISDRANKIDFAILPQPRKEFGIDLRSDWLTKKQISELSRFENLTYLVLVCGDARTSLLTDDSLAELRKCKHLKSLVVSHPKFGDISYTAISKLPQLKHFRLYKSSISADGFASTTGFSKLRCFYLSSSEITNDGLRKLCTIKSLREFLFDFAEVNDEGFSDMPLLVNLETLTLWEPVGREGMQSLCKLKSLRSLTVPLVDEKDRSHRFEHPLDARAANSKRLGFEFVHQLKTLEELSLSGRIFNAVDIDCLTTLPRLQALSFGSIFGRSVLDENACASIAKLENLKTLSLGLLQTDDAIAPICSMDNLEELDCSHAFNISDFGLTNIDQMKSLRKLSLANTKISNSTVMRRLVKMPQLKTLDLSGTWINDRSVKPLGTMKSLRELDISSTDITPQGSLKLEFKLPDTKVISSHSD